MGQFTLVKVSGRRSSRVRRRAGRRSARGPRRVPIAIVPLMVIAIALFGAFFAGIRVIAAVEGDLPIVADRRTPTEAQTSQIFAADGSTLAYLYGEENRTIVSSREISAYLKKAIVAMEDHRFHKHEGVDWEGLGRAVFINLEKGSTSSDATTSKPTPTSPPTAAEPTTTPPTTAAVMSEAATAVQSSTFESG